jgi:hypothetical protein
MYVVTHNPFPLDEQSQSLFEPWASVSSMISEMMKSEQGGASTDLCCAFPVLSLATFIRASQIRRARAVVVVFAVLRGFVRRGNVDRRNALSSQTVRAVRPNGEEQLVGSLVDEVLGLSPERLELRGKLSALFHGSHDTRVGDCWKNGTVRHEIRILKKTF